MKYQRWIPWIVCCLILASCGYQATPTAVPSTLAEATPPNQPSSVPTTRSQTTATPPTPDSGGEPATTSVPEVEVPSEPEITATQPNEPANSGKLIFGSGLDGSVRAIELTTGNELILADPTEVNQLLPWSAAPDGQSIAVITGYGFNRARSTSIEEAALWIVNTDQSEPRKLLDLVNNTLKTDEMTATWLPQMLTGQFQNIIWTADSREIIITSAHEGQVDLYAITIESGAVRQLTNTPDLEFDAALSPDGEWIAYGSTSNLGTGAGWGDVQVQTQAYLGGDVFTVIGDSDQAPPATATLLGWTSDNRVITMTSDNGAGTTILWRAAPSQAPQRIIEESAIRASTMQNDYLAYIVSDITQNQANNGVFTWNAMSDEQPIEIIEGTTGDFISWSPDTSAILICENIYNSQTPATLWHNGNLSELGSLNCQHHTWSDQSDLAVGNIIIREDQRSSLMPSTIPGAWDADTFYYFEPTADAGWQLYAQTADGLISTIGEPIEVEPYQIKLVR